MSHEPTIRLRTAVPGPESQRWMARRAASVPRGPVNIHPVFIAAGEGAALTDVDGNRLLDFAGGLGCLNAGHAPDGAVAGVQAQAARYMHACFHVTPNDGYVRLAEALNARAPGGVAKKTLLVNSGAEAVENAVKIARAFTGRQAVVGFEDAFHGRTLLGMSLTSKTHPYKAGFGPFAPEVYRMPFPYCYRCPVGLTRQGCNTACADHIADVFRREVAEESVAAVIIEPVLGEGGFVPVPREYFTRLAAECRARDILLIADEIQTGVGRTGSFYACEHYGIEPDLLLTGKSIAGGLPLAAVTGRAEVMDAAGVGGLGGTYGGNPLACEAALAVLAQYDAVDMGGRARAIGAQVEVALRRWQAHHPLVGDVRGVGAMLAIELVSDRATRAPAKEATAQVLQACLARGLVMLSAGTFGNVIRLLVPLVATDAQVQEGLAVMEAALHEVGARHAAAGAMNAPAH